MTSPPVSSKFPEGYGDFALESNDGTLCYFPSQILCYMSPVFEDMVSLGHEQGTGHKRSVKITEPLDALELFLTHLDPKKLKPAIDKETITGLLEMARKYQVDTIMQWFDQEANTQRTYGPVKQEQFSITYPGIAFSLARRFDLVETARMSLREFYSCHHQKLLNNAQYIGFSTYLEICRLRDKRIKRYHDWIDTMAENRGKAHQRWGDEGPEFKVDGDWCYACPDCIGYRVQWVIGMMKAVQLEPSWSGFSGAYHMDSEHCFSWSDHFWDLFQNWEMKAFQEESKLPDWPVKGLMIF